MPEFVRFAASKNSFQSEGDGLSFSKLASIEKLQGSEANCRSSKPISDIGQVSEPGSPTLIVGLENTLVNFVGKNSVFVRPFAEQFLAEIHRYFDVIVLSNLEEELVQGIVNRIDPESKWIQNIILLNSWADANILEELRLSGLFGERSIILKTPNDTVLGKSKREIAVPFWDKNNAQDRVLKDLLPILKGIIQLRVCDVEEYLKGIREQMILNVRKGSLTPYAHVVRSDPFLE